MNEWRFRKGFWGTLILQRLVPDHEAQYGQCWRDADVGDLQAYYKQGAL